MRQCNPPLSLSSLSTTLLLVCNYYYFSPSTTGLFFSRAPAAGRGGGRRIAGDGEDEGLGMAPIKAAVGARDFGGESCAGYISARSVVVVREFFRNRGWGLML